MSVIQTTLAFYSNKLLTGI